MNQKQNRPIFYWANLNMKERHFEKHKEPVYAPAGPLKFLLHQDQLKVQIARIEKSLDLTTINDDYSYKKLRTYLIIVIFFTLTQFLGNKIYTEKRQFFALNL